MNQFERLTSFSLLVLATIAMTGALIYTKAILIPFSIAIFLYILTKPIIDWVTVKTKLPYFLNAVLVFLISLLGTVLIVLLIVSSIESFAKDADVYNEKILSVLAWGSIQMTELGLPMNRDEITEYFKNFPVFDTLKNITGGLVTFLGNIFLISIILIFLLAGEVGSEKTKSKLISDIQEKVSQYILAKTLLSLATGFLVGMILLIFNVELAIVFAVLTFLLNFIPNIGSIVATALPLPIILLQYGFGWQFFVLFLLIGLVQMTIGNIIEPKVLGDSMQLHPITVLLFLLFWGLVWGIPGMFLAVPITAMMRIILMRFEITKPIAELLSGRLRLN